MSEPPEHRYQQRESTFRQAAAREALRSRQYSRVRLALVFLGVVAVVTAVVSPAWRDAAYAVIVAAIGTFIVIAIAHDRVERRRREQEALAELNHEAQHRRARAWTRLPEPPPVAVQDDHPYATDLDLVGHASLLQLIGPPHTPAGRKDLASWLLHLSDMTPEDVAARQASVRELAPRLDERQRIQAASLETRHLDAPAIEPLLHWAESESWLLQRPWIIWVSRVLGLATPLLMAAWSLEWVSIAPWLITATLGWLLFARTFVPMTATFEAASGEYTLRGFEALMTRVAGAPVESPLLVAARRALHAGPGRIPAARALEQLRQCVGIADVRLVLVFYLLVQTLVLWDFHAWWLLERWRKHHGRHLRGWLAALGRFEALSSLASLAHDQPEWTFPTVERGRDRIVTEGLGHPLLRDEVRVTNDVTLGPPGTFLLITGSNMSGKSTLLRAIGLNVILAHAGAPVCARTMTLPPLTLYTSIRVSDSLERGLSLFMASLLRLQRVVEAARHANPRERPLLYLLDEVLQGTNSAERQIAVRTIVGHLSRLGALGVVTTHDLELAAAPDFTANADSRHFSEQVSFVDGEAKMTFDHKLRAGPATSGNALQLVRMLGLDTP